MDTRAVGSWIRTVLTVTVVTLAVWLLAESRMVQTRSLDLRVALINIQRHAARLVERSLGGRRVHLSQSEESRELLAAIGNVAETAETNEPDDQ